MPIDVRDFNLKERVYIVSRMYNAISEHFAHWEDADFRPEELDDLYESFLERAIETADRREFTLLMMEMAAKLRNGHSGYVDQELYRRLPPLGFQMESIDGQWVVRKSVVNGLTPGDVVESMQGVTVDEWYSRTEKYLTAIKESSRKSQFQSFLPLIMNDRTIVVEFLDRNEERCSRSIERPEFMDQTDLQTEGRLLQPDVGYIRIPSFAKPAFEDRALQYVREFHAAKALIIDIRSNGGGNTPGKLIAALMNRPWQWWTERSRRPQSMFKRHRDDGTISFAKDYSYTEWKGNAIAPEQDAYQGQLIFLTDQYPGSSAEDFLMPFRTTGRGKILGGGTWGSTGQPYMHDFGNGAFLFVGSIRAYFPDGSGFEGVGISPDIDIRLNRQQYYDKQDPILSKALELINS